MNEQFQKQRIEEYISPMLEPATVEEISFVEEIEDESGTTNVWLICMDTGEEYWVLEGDYPADIFKKGGLMKQSQIAYEAYCQQRLESSVNTLDRFDQEQF